MTVYEGGLPQRQLSQVLDYMNDHLDHDIKLADLAALLDMSQFHFSHIFKQAIVSPPIGLSEADFAAIDTKRQVPALILLISAHDLG